jgi:Fe2+ or Zn2+ uptake regulation protein
MSVSGASILNQLQLHGYRCTRARRAVIGALVEAEGWLTPEALCLRARSSYPNLGLVTVYRTLNLLASLGFARRVHGSDSGHGYTAVEASHSHHLVCRRCHQTIEFRECELDEVINAIGNRTGYLIEGHMLELRGLCPHCQMQVSVHDQPDA